MSTRPSRPARGSRGRCRASGRSYEHDQNSLKEGTTMTEADKGFRSIFEDDPELINLIGTIVARWAYIDWKMVDVVCRAINGSTDQGKAIVYGAGSGLQRNGLIESVVRASGYHGLDKNKFENIMQKLNQLGPVRNMIIHAAPIWGGDKTQNLQSGFYYIQIRPNKRKNVRDWTQYKDAKSTLEQHAKDIGIVASDLGNLLFGNLKKLIDSIPKTIP